MIRKPKKQLFKYYFLIAVSFIIPLIGFFVYAAHFQTNFFIFIALALIVNIAILIAFYRRLKHKRASVKLQKEDFFEKANLMRIDLDKEAQVIGAFREEIVAYSQLKGFVEKLSLSLSLEDTVHTLCHEVGLLFEHRDTTIILYVFEPQSGELAIAYACRNHHAINIKQKRGDIFDRWIIKMLQPLLIEDISNDFRFDRDKVADEDGRSVVSLLSLPLVVHNKPVGILRLDSNQTNQFSKENLRFLKTISDVAAVAVDNAQLYDKVEDMAVRDGLTGLYLRRHLLERLDEELHRHLRRSKPLALIMFDLDHFKRYNDQFGHTAGDIVLKYFSGLLQKHFHSPGNLVCRYGGEEFCVLLPECGEKEAAMMAKEFVELLDKEDIILRRERTHMTTSAGVAAFPLNAKTKEDLIQKADAALYEAKSKGRNRVCVAHAGHGPRHAPKENEPS